MAAVLPRALETRKRTMQSSVTCTPQLNHFSQKSTGRVLRRRTRPPQTSETRCPRISGHRLDGMSSRPHVRQERQASSVRRPLEGQQRRKSPVRRCFKSRSSAENGVRRFASGCRNDFDGSPASCPVPRRPTHDHRRVRFGQVGNYAVSHGLQEIFCGDNKVFSR